MSQRSRQLGVGDWAVTDYNTRTDRPGSLVMVQITAVDRERRHGACQSGVLFQVAPSLKHGTLATWYDADWFEPVDPVPQGQLPL